MYGSTYLSNSIPLYYYNYSIYILFIVYSTSSRYSSHNTSIILSKNDSAIFLKRLAENTYLDQEFKEVIATGNTSFLANV